MIMKFSKRTLFMAVSIILCMTMTALGTVAYLTDRAKIENTFTVGNIEITLDETVVDENGDPVADLEGKKLVDDDNNPDTPDKPMTETEYNTWVDDQKNADPNKEYPAFDELKDADRTEEGNEYKLVPGADYTKDPTMTVKAGSEEAYLRMVMEMNCAAKLQEIFGDAQGILSEFIRGLNPEWDPEVIEDAAADTLTYVFKYKEAVDQYEAEEDLKLKLFDGIQIPTDVERDDLKALADLKITIEGHAIQTAAFDGNVDEAWKAFDNP